jgi:hypothetical protein
MSFLTRSRNGDVLGLGILTFSMTGGFLILAPSITRGVLSN